MWKIHLPKENDIDWLNMMLSKEKGKFARILIKRKIEQLKKGRA